MNTLLNIFTPLYSWCTSLGERLRTQDDFLSYYQNYFEGTSVCTSAFLVALLVAVAVACVYYFVCCNVSFATAKRSVWGLICALVFVLTLFVTPCVIVGHYDQAGLRDGYSHTLLFESAKQTLEDNLSYVEDDEAREEINAIAENYVAQFQSIGNVASPIGMFTIEEKIPLQMSLINGIYSLIIFFLLSIVLKRFTIHGKAIPF